MAKNKKKTKQKTEVKEGKPKKENNGKEKPDYSFTFKQEIGSGSRIPHWPGGKSGPTFGPGYDLWAHTKGQTYEYLATEIGVDKDDARELSEAADIKPKTPEKAKEWVNNWKNKHGEKPVISKQQEKTMFDKLVPTYEKKAKRVVSNRHDKSTWNKLSAAQKEMIFDFAYNPGSAKQFFNIIDAVVKENWKEVKKIYKRKSGNKFLTKRNKAFYKKYLKPKVEEREKGEEKKTKKCGAKCKYFEEYGYCDRLAYNPPCWQHRA